MSRFLETIRCFNGVLENLPWHEARLNRTRRAVFGAADEWNLAEKLAVPAEISPEQVYRCRLIYGREVELVEFIPYQPRALRALRLAPADGLDYGFKYADRAALEAFRANLPADEDALLVQNGLLTDTVYGNVALSDGTTWYTPAQPLLEGTQRARLLAESVLIRERLAVDDLRYFQKIRLFNAMLPWGEGPELPVEAVTPA